MSKKSFQNLSAIFVFVGLVVGLICPAWYGDQAIKLAAVSIGAAGVFAVLATSST